MHCLDIASDGKILDYKAVGFVHSTVRESDSFIETWLIKYDTDTCSFTIEPIDPNSYPDGSVIYWYTEGSDLTVRTDIFGEQMFHQSFTDPNINSNNR